MMSDTMNILKFFHGPFMVSWPPKMEDYKNEKTRNRNFENLNLNEKLTKIFDTNLSMYCK